jgi:hypothetical protein
MIVFSFSLYGNELMYTKGMIENTKLINRFYPEACIQIYIADDVSQETVAALSALPNVRLINVKRHEGIKNMFDRFLAIDDPECSIMIVRDADSRTHARDLACIEDFINSDKQLHIIRDHPWHNTQILGGLWGIKKYALNKPMKTLIEIWLNDKTSYPKSLDQDFLKDVIYPRLRPNALIHDRIGLYESPTDLTAFRVKIKDALFCGQVHRYDSNGKEYVEFAPHNKSILHRYIGK